MSDGMGQAVQAVDGEAREETKTCYEAQVAEVKNGFVVKVGCKTFVGTAKDLPMLLDYFVKKEVPAKLKKLKLGGAFRNCAEPEGMEGGCDKACDSGPGIPSFLRNGDGVSVVKVANGWVVMKHGEAYIATSKEEMVKLID